jgi:DNA end-binding protein Ku
VALVKIALRQREQLATLRVRDGVFVLETMLWPDEVREPDFPFREEKIDVRPQELAMASSLIETLSGDFDPSKYKDDYREALQAVIDAKVAGREVVTPPSAEAARPAGDLMAALRASIEAARAGRGETAAAGNGQPAAETGTDDETAAAGARAGRPRRTRSAPTADEASSAPSKEDADADAGSRSAAAGSGRGRQASTSTKKTSAKTGKKEPSDTRRSA